ncbi:uncharacterized protein LOC105735584 isoform X2 [Apis florea]|uniref:uncharacterized protein LOC105735584 isoform X2 n=1 Tax=Apis florea TaxID=7463 RepID=UPI0012FF448C|nr:uncharacterized protein LOC105735584 isoform X2 [Apis florea]
MWEIGGGTQSARNLGEWWAIDRPKSWCYSARRKVLVQDRKPCPGTLAADNESRVEGKLNPPNSALHFHTVCRRPVWKFDAAGTPSAYQY